MTYELLNPAFLMARKAELAELDITSLELRLALVEDSTLQYESWEARAIRDELKVRRAARRAAAAYRAGDSLG